MLSRPPSVTSSCNSVAAAGTAAVVVPLLPLAVAGVRPILPPLFAGAGVVAVSAAAISSCRNVVAPAPVVAPAADVASSAWSANLTDLTPAALLAVALLAVAG